MAGEIANINITVTDGGLNGNVESNTAVWALCTNGYAVSGGVQLNTSYEIFSLDDADDLLITTGYDANDSPAPDPVYPVLVRHHIEEFFRICKIFNISGKIWLRLTANTVTQAQMADKANTHLAQLLRDAGGEAWYASVGHNPAAAYSPTLLDGFDTGSLAAIPKAQELAEYEESQFRPLRGISIEGRAMNGALAAGSFVDARAKAAKYVDFVYFNDYDVAHSLGTQQEKYAAIGTHAGLICAQRFNVSPAAVETGNIQDITAGKYLVPGLSSGQKLSDKAESFPGTLHQKGLVGLRVFPQYAGVYVTGSPTCELVTSDYNCRENVGVVSKAIRLIYQSLLPKLSTPQLLNASTGRLADVTAALYQQIANDAVAGMLIPDATTGIPEVSGIKVTIPNQDDLRTNKVKVKFRIVPTNSNNGFDVEIGLAQTI